MGIWERLTAKEQFGVLTCSMVILWSFWYSFAAVWQSIPTARVIDILICPVWLALILKYTASMKKYTTVRAPLFWVSLGLGIFAGFYAWNGVIIGMPRIEGLEEPFMPRWTHESSYMTAFLMAGIPFVGALYYGYGAYERIWRNRFADMGMLCAFGFALATACAGALAVLGMATAFGILICVMYGAEILDKILMRLIIAKGARINPPHSRRH